MDALIVTTPAGQRIWLPGSTDAPVGVEASYPLPTPGTYFTRRTSTRSGYSIEVKGSGTAQIAARPIDADEKVIEPKHVQFITGTTTTLAAPLRPGDRTITLTSGAGWYGTAAKPAGTSAHARGIIVWNYRDGNSKLWASETYSRNVWLGLWADGGITGNVITLLKPWSKKYPTIPAGTAVSNSTSGDGTLLGEQITATSSWTTLDSEAPSFWGGGGVTKDGGFAWSLTIAAKGIEYGVKASADLKISPLELSTGGGGGVGGDGTARLVIPGGTPGADAVNIVQGHATNASATDIGGGVVLGGGTAGQNNVVGGDGSTTVGTATPNAASEGTGAHYSVVGGYDSVAGGLASIVLGFHNYTAVASTHGTIGGGSFQKVLASSDYGTIGGGTGHTIGGDGATIAGGVNGTVSADHGTIGGGSGNSVTGARSAVLGGINNVCSRENSAIVGGSNNVNRGDSAFILGGTSSQLGNVTNTSWGTYSCIGGGFQNLVATTGQAQYSVLAGGRTNSVQTDYGTVLGGRENAVHTRNYGQASGHGAVADKYGQNARAAGYFTTPGDAQASDLVARIQTTDATPKVMLLDGATWKMGMTASGNLWAFTGLVVAHRTGATGDNAAFKIEGALARDATAVGRLIGTPTVTSLGSEGTANGWTVAVTTNTSAELVLTVTGEASKTVRWVARVQVVEVAGA